MRIAINPRLPIVMVTLILVLASFGPNTALAVYAGVVLSLSVVWLWRPGETPVMLFIVIYQWFQASIKLIHANALDRPLYRLADFGGDIETATWLSLTGLLALAAGMALGAGRRDLQVIAWMREQASRHGVIYWFRLYLTAVAIAAAASVLARVIPSLSQLFLALALLKWAFFFMLTYATFAAPVVKRQLWLFAFAMELILGVGGYFSDFKTVLFVSMLSIAAVGIRFSIGRIVVLSGLAALTLVLAVVWTGVKVEYREFVSEGEQAQVVTVDYMTRMSKLVQLVSDLDEHGFARAVDGGLQRMSYVDFFGNTLLQVPRRVAHTDGALWFDAAARPFMPRVLFPGKSVIDDSARTRQFTGIRVTSAERGASISIGYLGESYIDFGKYLMMLPVFVYGIVLGWLYRWLAYRSRARGLLGMGMATAVLLGAFALETSITKVLGGLAAAALVCWLLLRFLPTRYLPDLLSPLGASKGLS